MTKVVYVAHPVGVGADRPLNIASTKLWLRALVEAIDSVAFSIPWLPYVEVLDESTHRDRGIRDDLAQLDRCDAIALTGGRTSPGMTIERDRMRDLARGVVDLTGLTIGGEPVGILTPTNYHLTQTAAFRWRVREAFRGVA